MPGRRAKGKPKKTAEAPPTVQMPPRGCCWLLAVPIAIVGGLAAWMMIRASNRQDNVAFDIAPQEDRIVFSAAGEGGSDLYTLDLQTQRVSRVTATPDYEANPAFSPDGRRIVFSASQSVGKAAHLYTCALDGSDRRQLTSGGAAYDSLPSYSHDGKEMVFARAARLRPYSMGGYTWDDWDVWRVNADGTGLTPLTHARYYGVFAPHFSPDGRHILFSAWHTVGGKSVADVFLTIADGMAPPAPLTTNGHSSDTAYSPDGKEIALISDKAKAFDYDVWRMSADGAQWTRVTHNGSYDVSPRFAPDGQRILFLSDPNRARRYDLWSVDVDGGGLRRLADSSLFDDPLKWNGR